MANNSSQARERGPGGGLNDSLLSGGGGSAGGKAASDGGRAAAAAVAAAAALQQLLQQLQQHQQQLGVAAAAAHTVAAAAPVALGLGRPGSSRFVGVSWNKANRKWKASLCVSGEKRKHLGFHASEEDAARARDAEVRRRNLSPAMLHFPAEAQAAAAAAPVARVPTGASRFRGVQWHKERSKWKASLYVAGEKPRFLGYHASEEDAARAYDDEVRRRNLPTVLLNFWA